MYTLKTTVAKPKAPFTAWSYIDAGPMRFSDLFSQYTQMYFVLENEFLPDEVCLDADIIRAQVIGTTLTVEEFLVANGNQTLPTITTVPKIRTHRVRYNDAVRAGYRPYLTDGVSSIDDQTIAGKNSVKLVRDGVDFEQFYKHMLVSVNGYYHRTDFDPQGAFVYDCVPSLIKTGYNHIGLTSFEGVGELSFYPITTDMLYKRYPQTPYAQRVDLHLPVEHTNKVEILVIGGYKHLGYDGLFRRSGTHTLTVDFNQFNWLDRYLESNHTLDLSALGLTVSPNNPQLVNIEQLHSDEVIERYFTMSQSFVVLLDAHDLTWNHHYVYQNGVGAQTYGSGVEPTSPLVIGRGRLSNYWPRKEWAPTGHYWSLACTGNKLPSLLHRTTPVDELVNVDDARTGAWPYRPWRPSPAYLLELATTTIWE